MQQFLDAFNVTGYLWPNGERGSGKTQLLTLIAELGYLGQMLLAGGSFASLRDLADYGATLCFDDGENFSDPKKCDPDKRALLIVGNRRGNYVPVKEPRSDKTWKTRYVSTYCARAFSAIRLPDATLASRTIIIPLIRTPDRFRANADPLDYRLWPSDRRELIDDLWAMSLSNLAEMPQFENLTNEGARLFGRNLEPWRPILAIAAWLETKGVCGIWSRIEALSAGYQKEKQELEGNDMTVLVVKALCRCCAGCGISDVCDISDVCREGSWRLRTSEITETAKAIALDEELDFEQEYITAKRIGKTLGRMRMQTDREHGTGNRGWRITPDDLKRWTISQGLNTQNEN